MPQRIVQLLILTVVLTTQAEDNPSLYQSVFISGIPHIVQKKDFCGEACATMYLKKLGENMDQDYIFDRAGVDPIEARGLNAMELKKAHIKIGFDVGPVWLELQSKKELNEQFRALWEDLGRGIPSIVCTRVSFDNDDERFRLVLGYSAPDDSVIYHEPANSTCQANIGDSGAGPRANAQRGFSRFMGAPRAIPVGSNSVST